MLLIAVYERGKFGFIPRLLSRLSPKLAGDQIENVAPDGNRWKKLVFFFFGLAYGLKQLAMNERLNENERGSAHNKVKILSFCVFRADFFCVTLQMPRGPRV